MNDNPTCKKCGDTLTSDTWYKSSQKYGHHFCKTCLKRDQRARLDANPKGIEYSMLANAKHRAKIGGFPFEITLDDIKIPATCPVLGIPIKPNLGSKLNDSSPTLDKILPSLGYVKGNIAVISWKANRVKNNASFAELSAVFNWMAQQNIHFENIEKI